MGESLNHTVHNILPPFPGPLPPIRIDAFQFELTANSWPLAQKQLKEITFKLQCGDKPRSYSSQSVYLEGLAGEFLENSKVYCGLAKMMSGGQITTNGYRRKCLHANLHKCTRLALNLELPWKKTPKDFAKNKFTNEEMEIIRQTLGSRPLADFQIELIAKLLEDTRAQFSKAHQSWFGVEPDLSTPIKIPTVEFCVDYIVTPDQSTELRGEIDGAMRRIFGEHAKSTLYRENESTIFHWSLATTDNFLGKNAKIIVYDKAGNVRVEVRFYEVCMDTAWGDTNATEQVASVLSEFHNQAEKLFQKIHGGFLSRFPTPQIVPQEFERILNTKYKIKKSTLRLPEFQHFISLICAGRSYHPAGTYRQKKFRIENSYFKGRMADEWIGFLQAKKVEGLDKQGHEIIYALRDGWDERLNGPVIWDSPRRENSKQLVCPTTVEPLQEEISRRDFLRKFGFPLKA